MSTFPYRLVQLKKDFDISTLLEPPNWTPNSIQGYYRHQRVLGTFIKFCLELGCTVELPIFEENANWDYGVDVVVNGLIIDIKSFGLREDAKTKTFDSEAYRGKGHCPKSFTKWLIFVPEGSSPSLWEAAPFHKQRKSKFGYPPYFWKSDVVHFSKLQWC
jgi:hypothetical protein